MKPSLRPVLISHLRSLSRSTQTRTIRIRPSSSPSAKRNHNVSEKSSDSSTTPPSTPPPTPPSVSDALAAADDADNNLLAPVHMPEDANAVLKSSHPATNILAQSGLVIQRQLEMMNLLIGFEQANRYVIMDPHGNHIGYMAEHDGGFGKSMSRQMFNTHRPFTTNVFDKHGTEVLRFHRPFSWINSRIRVYDPLEVADRSQIPYSSSRSISPANPEIERRISSMPLEAMRIIGEAHSEWAPLRRKYNLFLAHDPSISSDLPAPISIESPADLSLSQQNQISKQPSPSFAQFAYVDEPFLSWDFSLLGHDKRLIGSVNRNFAGFAREIFTETGVYALRMDSAGLQEEADKGHIISKTSQNERAYADVLGGAEGMTLDQRALMLATAVTVDFDYFSRKGGGWMPIPLWLGGGGGEAAGGAAAGGAVGAGEAAEGAVIGGAGRAVGGAAGAGVGVGEGAMAGAGTMAGYEAMQRGMDQDAGQQLPDQSNDGWQDPYSPQSGKGDDLWGGGENDPWSAGAGDGGGGGGGEGGGFFSWLWDMFFGD